MPKSGDQSYKTAFHYLAGVIKPHKRFYFTASFIALVLTGTGLLNTKVTQTLINNSISGDISGVVRSIILFALIITANMALGYISGRCTARLSSNATKDIKRGTAHRLLHAEYGVLIREKAGDLLSTVNMDSQTVSDFLAGDLIRLFSQTMMLLGALIYLISINPLLALITFAYTPIGMFFTLKLNGKMNRLYPIRAAKAGEALAVTEQVLMQIPVIKSFLMEKRIKATLADSFDDVYKTEMKIALPAAFLEPACQSTSSIPRVLFLVVAGHMVMRGDLSLGALIAVFDLLNFIIGPTVYFPFMLNGFNKAIASINRLRRVQQLPLTQRPQKTSFNGTPSIAIKAMNFGYALGQPIFNSFSFSHNGTGIIAIKGKSGSGKTTLLDLIAGLYQADSGVISVSGGVSAVAQESYLFSESILENIQKGRPDAAEDDIISAANQSGVDSFADTFSGKLHTMVGEGFGDLSGGQKQRISLARTILSDAPIWLLDEPTAALDPKTEQIIMQTLEKQRGNRLILVSAHRKFLIDIADAVIDLDEAREAAVCI